MSGNKNEDRTDPFEDEYLLDRINQLYDKNLTLLQALLKQSHWEDNKLGLLRQQEDILSYLEWLVTKTELKYHRQQKTPFPLIRNGLYWAELGQNIGSEYNKRRPVIVISAIPGSTVTTVIPLTTKRKNDGRWTHIDLECHDSTALCEHLRVISKARLQKPLHVTKKNTEGTNYRKNQRDRILALSSQDKHQIRATLKRLYTIVD
ncbi:type II toxin-antitoxin system PemK/MazF family toxin [Shimazuella kribbensis]|uniref:type II toxin-antitoxin system PemK/MazF family toxin n=1 Tax=Shimazuella kribbensis TaxID=139808 RepID=UPI0004176CDC|nr:type II toxin-antitoxin system PemK/MazF family toxin [Shimazuella kribbensis]